MDKAGAASQPKVNPLKEAVNASKGIVSVVESGIEERTQQHIDSAYRAEKNRGDSLQSVVDSLSNEK